MSRQAYENYFGQPAPEGALFGADISWFQATPDGESLSYSVAAGYWEDISSWADFVCIRTSYGSSGNDGAEGLHFQVARDYGFTGKLGTYHFVHPSTSWQGNLENYLTASAPYVSSTSFDMLDFEAAPTASAAYVDAFCDAVQMARGRPCLVYGGKGYLDGSGTITCPSSRYWAAHYPARSADAWSPTTSWASNGAPLMPNQYYGEYPGVWQWQSQTPEHGHLDLNISTTPEAFGIGEVEDMTPEQSTQLDTLYHIFMDEGGRWGKLWTAAAQTGDIHSYLDDLIHAMQVVERLNLDSYAKSTGAGNGRNFYDDVLTVISKPVATADEIAKAVVSAMPTDSSGGATEVDYDKIAAIVDAALKKLVLHAD